MGRHFTEAPDITARICGICPVAYQMSACAAMEDACGVVVDDRVARPAPAPLLRRVDPEPRPAHLPAARPGLPRLRRRRRAGRAGPRRGGAGARHQAHRQPGHGDGRRPGGPPRQRPGRRLLPGPRPRRGRGPGRAACAGPATTPRRRWSGWRASTSPTSTATTASWPCATPDRYPIERGRPASSDGLDTEPGGVRRPGRSRSTWPAPPPCTPASAAATPTSPGRLARYALNSAALPPLAAEAAAAAGLGPVCRNPFRSIVVRAVELVFACDEALALVESLRAARPARRRRRAAAPGRGPGATEAPAGPALPPLRDRRRRHHPHGPHRAAHLAEPAHHRGRPPPGRRRVASTSTTTSCSGAASRPCATTTRASRAPPTSSTSRW